LRSSLRVWLLFSNMERTWKRIRPKRSCVESSGTFSTAISILCLTLFAAACVSRHPGSDAPSPPSGKIEIKLLVPADKVAGAARMLKLDAKPGVKEQVFFFDTTNYVLDAHNLILRARQKAGHPADSTVKYRTKSTADKLSDAEKHISPEEDWSSETAPAISRSLDWDRLPDGLLGEVDRGRWTVDRLFDGAQRQMVEARMTNFKWQALRRFGPIQAELWDDQFKLEDFPEAVTVERWHIERGSQTLEILELSAKARPKTNADAKRLADEFFRSAEKAGLGRPGGQSKTTLIFDFFKPGR
jgi:hypothetical protein